MTESVQSASKYPPSLNAAQLTRLIDHVKDYQLTHGSLIKLIRTSSEHSVLSRPIGTCIFPSLFPHRCFDAAVALQQTFNRLYAHVACDELWLTKVLIHLIEHDDFAATLMDIYQAVKEDYPSRKQLELGIFRSDYMLQDLGGQSTPQIKQVEFNTYSCAGGTHGNIVSDMHRHLAKQGAYRSLAANSLNPVDIENLPENETVKSLVAGLARAHTAYGPSHIQHPDVLGTCVLIVVQPNNVNICDERPLEYQLWATNPAVPTFRVVFGEETLAETRLSVNKELLYQVDATGPIWEVAVIYMRAGYDPAEYSEAGIACRVQLERSIAIKCPSLLTHLCTFKKVQQALTDPSALARFLPPELAIAVSATFVPMYPLDASASGQQAKKLVLDTELAAKHVLKPSLEGGGHNVYGVDIPSFLADLPENLWANHVLMEMIEPPEGVNNIIMTYDGLYDGAIKSELGIFGICMWERDESGRPRILENTNAGWSFKSKVDTADEMSVIKGYGAFDSPYLVDLEVFNNLKEPTKSAS